MLVGNDKKYNGIAFVCYLDILGFSKDVCNNWGKSPDPLEKILSIKKKINDTIDADIRGAKEDGELATVFLPYVKTVSDSFMFCFRCCKKDALPVNSSYCEAVFKAPARVFGLTSILSGISVVWSEAIKCGYTIRGAIDLGEVYWDENDLIGPAFITAYNLESKCAKKSRIIISSEINKLFLKMVTDGYADFISAIKLFENFRKDDDDYIIVDPNIMREKKTDTEVNELIEKLEKLRDAAPNEEAKKKYYQLIEMLKEGKTIGLKDTDLGNSYPTLPC